MVVEELGVVEVVVVVFVDAGFVNPVLLEKRVIVFRHLVRIVLEQTQVIQVIFPVSWQPEEPLAVVEDCLEIVVPVVLVLLSA